MTLRELLKSPMFRFLAVLTIASTMGLQSWRTLFDNFAVNVVGLEGDQIGLIQGLREVPGFLSLLVIYVMFLMREHRIAAISTVVLALGLAATGLFPSYLGLIVTTFVMSTGFHYFETTAQSLTLQYFDEKASPVVFGQLRSLSALSNIVVGGLILVLAAFLSYSSIYLMLGGLILIAALWSFRVNPSSPQAAPQQKKMILRRKYWLYYVLTFLAGARRQIFVAFAVFLLVKKFGYGIQEITLLFVVNNVVNYFLSPLIGRAILRFGERRVLSLEYFSLLFIFCAYALVDSKLMVAALYILDHIFFNFSIAIRTFFQKIGDPEHVAPTMAMGFTINHIGAVLFPLLGGMLWMIDYRIPFAVGAISSLCSLAAAQFIDGQVRRLARAPAPQAAVV